MIIILTSRILRVNFYVFIRYYTVIQLTLGNQRHSNQLLKYYCSTCDILLRTTIDIDIGVKFSSSREECPHCGCSLVSETLRKEEAEPAEQQTNIKSGNTSSLLLPPKIQIAYQEFSSRLTFDIEKIDSVLKLTAGESVCIVAANEKYPNILITRLCVRALMSNRQGGFNSSKVIFVDAGNTSDIYQCVNFARQYGLNIKKVLQSIVVSRSFTIYQLANMIINELPKVIEQFAETRVIIISDLLSMFVNEPQIQIKEAESLIRQIANAIIKMSSYSNILFLISFYSNMRNNQPSSIHAYDKLLLQRVDKCIIITKGNTDNSNNLLINIKSKKNHSQEHSVLLQEKVLHLVSDK